MVTWLHVIGENMVVQSWVFISLLGAEGSRERNQPGQDTTKSLTLASHLGLTLETFYNFSTWYYPLGTKFSTFEPLQGILFSNLRKSLLQIFDIKYSRIKIFQDGRKDISSNMTNSLGLIQILGKISKFRIDT